ncbi:MAG: acyltransferase [Gammaproteobacteria bacterium]|nr:acyltransferase [Gammaproteobacteria bacterium]
MAILCVLTGHFLGTDFIKEDRLGVDIFFVLSGMLMAQLLFEKRINLKTFYLRRFSRIYPTLFVFVACMFLGASIVGWEFSGFEVLTNLTFLRTYIPTNPHIWEGFVPVKNLWSLNVEEHAYVIMSLMTLFLVALRGIRLALLSIGVLSVLISIYYNATQDYQQTYFLLRTESAIAFVALSASYRLIQHEKNLRVNPWIPLITLAAATLCYLEQIPFWISFVFPPFLLAFTVNHLQDLPPVFKRLLSLKILRLFGLWSYSIYLWQQPIFEYKWTIPGPDFAIPLFLAIATGVLSFTFFESPSRIAINDWWARRVQRKTAAAGML